MSEHPVYATFADGHEAMSVGDAIANSSRTGGWVEVRPVRLGFLTAPLPDTPLMEVADWAAANEFDSLEIVALAARWRHRAALRRHLAHRRRQPVAGRSQRHRRTDRSEGLKISGLGFYPNPLHPDPAVRDPAIAHIKKVIEACRLMGVPYMNTFMGGDSKKDLDDNWQEALRVWPDIVSHAQDNGVQATDRELPDDLFARRVAERQQHRLVALHLAAHPRAVGRHDRAQLRPVAPGLADDRPGPLHPRVRAAHPPLPGEGRADRPRRAVRARLDVVRHRLADPRLPGLGDADWGEIFSNLYRVGYDGDCIIEHEDRRFEGTDQLVKRGFLLARNILRPYIPKG